MKLYRIIALLGASLSIYGCANPPQHDSPYAQVYQGSHVLHQIGSFTSQETHSSAGFFLIAGNSHSDSSTDTKVTFSWLGNDGVYRFTSVSLSDIQVRIDDSIGLPYVRFRWSNHGDIRYAVITVRSSDWPTSIHVPNAGDLK
jgi:hypothetical protein